MPSGQVSRYFDAFLELLVAERGAAANTLVAYQRDLEDVTRFLAGRDTTARAVLDTATTEDLRRYLKAGQGPSGGPAAAEPLPLLPPALFPGPAAAEPLPLLPPVLPDASFACKRLSMLVAVCFSTLSVEVVARRNEIDSSTVVLTQPNSEAQ